MLESLTSFFIHFIQTSGYVGVFSLMLLGSALIPIPSEVVLPFTGFLTSHGNFSYPLVVVIAALGDVAGSIILYGIGYLLEENVLLYVIKKYGKYVLLSEQDYNKSSIWFKKYGSPVVFFGKLIPGLRYLISLPAGVLKMNLPKFILFSFLGSIIWCSIMIYIGLYLGNRWETLSPYFSKFSDLILVGILILIVVYINHKLHIFAPGKKHTKKS